MALLIIFKDWQKIHKACTFIAYLLEQDFPFVAFGRSNPEWDFPWVDVDGADGMKQAVAHLLELSHQRVACLAWPEASLTGQYRLDGYREAMASAGLSVGFSPVVVGTILRPR